MARNPINENLLNRIREALVDLPNVSEKTMFGGVCFMVDDKLCVCLNDAMLCRIGPEGYEKAVKANGVRPALIGSRTMMGYVYVDESILNKQASLDHWISKALAYNKVAKASKKRK